MERIPNVPPTERLKYFLKSRKKITTDPIIRAYVDYFVRNTNSKSLQSPVSMKEEEKVLAEKEIEEITKKEVKAPAYNETEQFLRLILIASKKSSGFWPAIDSKKHEFICGKQPFQNESLMSSERTSPERRLPLQSASHLFFSSFSTETKFSPISPLLYWSSF